MKVHLVDGTYELFRAFFGAPPQQDPEGREVGAAIGLARSLLTLLRSPDVTHVACAFDHVIESFRNDLFPGYKTGEGIDPELLAQFPLAEKITDALGILVWPMVEFEADDALATAAAHLVDTQDVEQVVICTPDKDLAQCVDGSRIVCLNRRTGDILTEQGVVEKFGVWPASIPDYLALVGDSADGIPGIPGWGKKSASVVLKTYGRIERIPENHEEWLVAVRSAARLAENLNQGRAEAALYRRLATLRTDAPVEADPARLEWRGARPDALESLCAELDAPELLQRTWRFLED